MKETKLIPLDNISLHPDFQRTTTDSRADADLLASIRQLGIIYPLIILQSDTGYILVAGYRRYEAAKQLNIPSIPCHILTGGIDDAEVMRLHENLFRKDISPLEEAVSLARLETTYHFTREKISKVIGKSKGYVTQRIQILQYPPPLKEALAGNLIPFSVARELSSITDIPHIVSLISLCVQSGATVRTVTGWVQEWRTSQPTSTSSISSTSTSNNIPSNSADTTHCYFCGNNHTSSPIHSIFVCKECFDIITSNLEPISHTPPNTTPNPDTPNTTQHDPPDPPNTPPASEPNSL